MNRHGETFDDTPPPGDYKVCPIDGCKYKLLTAPYRPGVLVPLRLPSAPGLTSLDDIAREALLGEARRQEGLLVAHLKTHRLMDFYRTREAIMSRAHDEVSKIMKIADLVFNATATQGRE